MNKIITAGLVAGIALVILSFLGLYATIWFFPDIASQYFDPVFETGPEKMILYYIHPFVISMSLSFFWSQFKKILTGSFLTRGIEFGMIYTLIATLPMMWLIYCSMNVSMVMVATWALFAMMQAVVAGLIFEKMNP